VDLDTDGTDVVAMAQDLIALAPEAVVRQASDGYYRASAIGRSTSVTSAISLCPVLLFGHHV
jgi:hypothetical protein